MDLKEKNWENFCNHNLRELYGLWAGYTPQKEVFGTFKIIKNFQSNQARTEITQSNEYRFTDGKIQNQSWHFSKDSSNLADGIVHPESPSMRSLFFNWGAAASVFKQSETEVSCRIQFSFKYENLVSSVVIFYDENNSLMRTVCMRFDTDSFSSQHWSTEINLLPERNLSGNWQGTSVTMTPDLRVSVPEPTQLQWPVQGNETFFFPDGLSLSCPDKVSVGNPFTLAANWLVTPSKLQQLSAKYDESGAFAALTLELLHL